MSEPIDRVTSAIRSAEGLAICAYITAGYPSRAEFGAVLASVASVADLVEVGIPFTDPMADGLTIQRASERALGDGVDLGWAIETVGAAGIETPWLLMGYYNPFLAFGLDEVASALAGAGGSGLIVPDLPLEESDTLSTALDGDGLGLVQLVAPTTPNDRLRRLAAASEGFVYAVTSLGVTGGSTLFDPEVLAYLDRVRDVSDLPVMAGFGVRERRQVEGLSDHVDGVVVGSALIDAIDRGEDIAEFLAGLRVAPRSLGTRAQ